MTHRSFFLFFFFIKEAGSIFIVTPPFGLLVKHSNNLNIFCEQFSFRGVYFLVREGEKKERSYSGHVMVL